jgi:carboxymethylenebutenolidase
MTFTNDVPTTDIPMSRPTPTLGLTPCTPCITGRLLYLVGEDDALIEAAQRDQIAAALAGAAVDHELVTYPGTAHAYFWPGTPPFSQAARDDSWSPMPSQPNGPAHTRHSGNSTPSGRWR